MKRSIRNSHAVFCRNVYNPVLNFERVIEAEEVYLRVLRNIAEYIEKYLLVWCLVRESEVGISKVKQEVAENEQIVRETDELWGRIQEFVQSNMKWKSAYIHYNYYIKHHKLRTRDIDDIAKSSYYSENEVELKNTEKISKKHMTDNESCIFTAKLL